MLLGPRPWQAESCRSHVQDYLQGSRSVHGEAFTAVIFDACVNFVRTRIHPSSLAAQSPPCTRPPNSCSMRTPTAQSFFTACRPRKQGNRQRGGQWQQPQASGRGGLQPQSRRVDSAGAFPTLRSGNQFDMPNMSGMDERRDERRSRTRSPPAARGGRSASQIESFGPA